MASNPNANINFLNRNSGLYSNQGQNFPVNEAPSSSHENFSMFEHLHNQGLPQQGFSSNQATFLTQPPLSQQQQAERKKKSLTVNSKNFQNIPAMTSKYGSQTHVDANSTYDSSTDVTLSSVATEPSQIMNSFQINTLNTYPIEHLDIASFKLKPCTLNSQHNHKQCPFYHNSKDRKRPGNFYSSDLCEFAETAENCLNGDMCLRAHNRVEQLYKPDKYKTKFCGHYPLNIHLCEYGTFCSFAHNEHDISIDLIHNFEYDDDFYMFHYKTIWCPFNLTQHDKALCVYAHNWQDYRRKPHQCSYDPLPCPNWKSTDFIVNYEDGCPLKEKCSKCHGWKELEYHPLNYKTKHCPSKNCMKGRDCPHYHHMKDRRAITTTLANRVFKLMPRNRVVTGTFKKRKDDLLGSYKNQTASNELNTSLDGGVGLLGSMGSLNELPTQEQLKWMNSMIQNMMAAQSMNEIPSRKAESEEKRNVKRRSSIDSPLKIKRPQAEPHSNYHLLNLFGAPQRLDQQKDQPLEDILGGNDLPTKQHGPYSIHNLDDPKLHRESPIYSNDDYLDNQFRHSLEKIIDNDEI